nr:PREDICTED: UDP-glycosyltransferase 85A8-like isoform X1 [Daucus carota subsp. sativus]XP_017223778.1 PREDICTED: UDP-glycosyltransferase 85A8-like isoform X2 [Daucus carota subsp. sativus]
MAPKKRSRSSTDEKAAEDVISSKRVTRSSSTSTTISTAPPPPAKKTPKTKALVEKPSKPPGPVKKTPKTKPPVTVVIEHCKQCNQFKTRAIKVKDALENDITGINVLVNPEKDTRLASIGSSLWKEESSCIDWLDEREANSVIYVNFGSITPMSAKQLTEFAWGLANSNKPFLWIVRPDIIAGDEAMVPPEFLAETRERGMLASWCSQEQVLKHPATAGFLTHSGWNSSMETLSSGVPVICWPFFSDQQTNCKYSCAEWGIGLEIDNNVKRNEVEELVRELMDGEKGKQMKKNAVEWKKKAEAAAAISGSSAMSLDRLVTEVLLAK